MNAMYMLCTHTNTPIHRRYSEASPQISRGTPMMSRKTRRAEKGAR